MDKAEKNLDSVLIGLTIGLAVVGVAAYIFRDKIKQAAVALAKTDTGKAIINYGFSKEQESYLSELHPQYQDIFRKFIADIETHLGYKVLVTSGYRTFAQQAKEHAANKANAEIGKSLHNYGAAIDLNLISKKDGHYVNKDSSDDEWRKSGVVDLGTKYGLYWGGGNNFGSYHDPVHFEVHKYSGKGSQLLSQATKQFGSVDKIIGNQVNLA